MAQAMRRQVAEAGSVCSVCVWCPTIDPAAELLVGESPTVEMKLPRGTNDVNFAIGLDAKRMHSDVATI